MKKKPTVADYMVTDVASVEPTLTVYDCSKELINTPYHGLPVTEKGILLGFITAKELLRNTHRPKAKIREVMRMGTVSANPSMSLDDATRVLFRYSIRNLPIVDDRMRLIGIISNVDIVRSHIERTKPNKVRMLKSFLEKQHGLRVTMSEGDVRISELRPTQKEVFRDELIGRQHEINRGLIEPLIVVKRRSHHLLVDGHHRALAAKQMGMRDFSAIILEPDTYDVPLGMEKTAEQWGIRTLEDITVIEGSKHPFVEITTRLLGQEDEKLEPVVPVDEEK